MRELPTIEYAEARRAIDTIVSEVARRGKAAVVVVADAHGELIALARMDGAPLTSITIACNKAYTAARAGKPSKDIGDRVRHPENGHDIAYFGDPRFTGWGGGIPVMRGGMVAGALAVSGLPQVEDMEVASLGVAALTPSA
jgi:glc operon protein GlcG